MLERSDFSGYFAFFLPITELRKLVYSYFELNDFIGNRDNMSHLLQTEQKNSEFSRYLVTSYQKNIPNEEKVFLVEDSLKTNTKKYKEKLGGHYAELADYFMSICGNEIGRFDDTLIDSIKYAAIARAMIYLINMSLLINLGNIDTTLFNFFSSAAFKLTEKGSIKELKDFQKNNPGMDKKKQVINFLFSSLENGIYYKRYLLI